MSLAFAFVTLLALASGPSPVRFPGAQDQTVSPSGLYAIAWLSPDAPGGTDRHRLVLRDRGVGAERPLLEFGRWVDVAWSPDGSRFAVTDAFASDFSEVSVHSVRGGLAVLAWRLLSDQVGRAELGFTAGAHHLYVEAVGWGSDTSLTIRVWGYGGAAPFDRRFRVRVDE